MDEGSEDWTEGFRWQGLDMQALSGLSLSEVNGMEES